MGDDDFKQMVLDRLDYFFEFEQRRHETIMTSNQDVMNEIAKNTAALLQLDTTVKTALADAGTGGDAARAAFVTVLQAQQAQIAKMETEHAAAIVAATSPPAVPAA